MRRGTRQSTLDVDALQRELEALKERQAQVRQQLRLARGGSSSVGKLEGKLAKQLATAKWTVWEIRGLQPEWDELAFYRQVEAAQPKPRGRRGATASNNPPSE